MKLPDQILRELGTHSTDVFSQALKASTDLIRMITTDETEIVPSDLYFFSNYLTVAHDYACLLSDQEDQETRELNAEIEQMTKELGESLMEVENLRNTVKSYNLLFESNRMIIQSLENQLREAPPKESTTN